MSTKIEWCDETWNPITGCTPISEGCKNCYAMRMFGRNLWGYDSKVRFHPERLDIPAGWKKPRKIFVGSMTDLFHKDVPLEWIAETMRTILKNPQHIFMVLTKRPERMKTALQATGTNYRWELPNLWLGVTAENQKRADERIPILLQTPAAVRFVSCEPLLERIYLDKYFSYYDENEISGKYPCIRIGIDWVIIGPETGTCARYCDQSWIGRLAYQAKENNIPYFVKRMANGEKAPEAWQQWPEHPTTKNPHHTAGASGFPSNEGVSGGISAL